MKSFQTDKGCLKLDALWNHLGEMKDVAERVTSFSKAKIGDAFNFSNPSC